jgi:hypothetical protein
MSSPQAFTFGAHLAPGGVPQDVRSRSVPATETRAVLPADRHRRGVGGARALAARMRRLTRMRELRWLGGENKGDFSGRHWCYSHGFEEPGHTTGYGGKPRRHVLIPHDAFVDNRRSAA